MVKIKMRYDGTDSTILSHNDKNYYIKKAS